MRRSGIVVFLMAFSAFLTVSHFKNSPSDAASKSQNLMPRVVVAPSVLSFLYGGDRFLAANFEVFRLAATSVDRGILDGVYLARAQRVVSELNPCHEDNYYLASGLLTWGGAAEDSAFILQRATQCRYWDPLPPFFYGINHSVLGVQDLDAAVSALELSAARWPENYSSLRRMAIMLRSNSFDSLQVSLNFLNSQREASRDEHLNSMLDQRIERLKGLIFLRAAQREYESTYGVLDRLERLVESGVVSALPHDPLELGYELKSGRVELKKLQIAGMEN